MTTSAEIEGHAATVVGLPPESPRGDLRVLPLGFGTVGTPNGRSRALFVRVVVRNESEESWTLREGLQTVELDERGFSVASYAAPSQHDAGVHTILPHRSETVDLAFPAGSRDEGDIRYFVIHWTLDIGARRLAGDVEFTRQLEPKKPL